MNEPTVLIVEADILVRNPLADYLRACGYRVLEAFDTVEARRIFGDGPRSVEVVLADVEAPGENGFTFALWVRANHPDAEVILAGSVARAAEKAGELCREGPALSKPYDHQLVHNEIRRLLAKRDRNKSGE
jgi:DNA-binding response OmpR family regulator